MKTVMFGLPCVFKDWDGDELNNRPSYTFEDGAVYYPPVEHSGTQYMAYWSV